MKGERWDLNGGVLKKKIWKLEVSDYIVLLTVLIYTLVFSYYSIMKHYSFRSYAWDIGILVQSIASAVKGNFFINNVERYYSPTGSYFGVHFSPILFLVIPFFYLAPKVETIFIIQSFVLSLSGIPSYLLAKHCLKDRLASLLFFVSYLLNPSLQGINWYHFPPQTFLPLLFLSATYFLKKRKLIPFFTFIFLALMTVEQTSFIVILYAVYVAWEIREDFKKLFYSKKTSNTLLMPFVTFTAAIAWAIFAQNVIYTVNPNPSPELRAIGNFAILDIESLNEIPVKIIMKPNKVIEAIRYDFLEKTFYILLTFAPSGFIALLKPLTILPALSWLFLSMLSNHAPYYEFGFHYTALTLPFITVATLEAIEKLPGEFDLRSSRRVYRKLSTMLLLIGLALSVFASPLSFMHKPGDFRYFRDYGISYPSSLDREVMKILNNISKDALILTTPTIFPFISTNPNAYVIPPINSPSPRLFEGHLRYLKSIKYDYIIYTYFWDKSESNMLYNDFIEGSDIYKLFIKGPGLEIYKEGYKDPPINIAIKFSYKELTIADSIVIDDPSSDSGKVIMIKPSQKVVRYGWYGPYITLLPGNYTANFRIKIDNLSDDKLLTLDIWSNSLGSRIASYDLYGKYFRKPFTWHTFSIPFNLTKRVVDIEFRGLKATGDITIWLDYVEVIPEP